MAQGNNTKEANRHLQSEVASTSDQSNPLTQGIDKSIIALMIMLNRYLLKYYEHTKRKKVQRQLNFD
jgi:hypothetical protein